MHAFFKGILLVAFIAVGSLAKAQDLKPNAVDTGAKRDGLLRLWADSTGTYQVKARLQSCHSGTVKLQKEDGTVIPLSLERLSKSDQAFVAKAQRTSIARERERKKERAKGLNRKVATLRILKAVVRGTVSATKSRSELELVLTLQELIGI